MLSGLCKDVYTIEIVEPLARAAMGGEADIDRAVEAARAALEGPWGKTPPTERSRLLHALADALATLHVSTAAADVTFSIHGISGPVIVRVPRGFAR